LSALLLRGGTLSLSVLSGDMGFYADSNGGQGFRRGS
jgi:hypothetical protein